MAATRIPLFPLGLVLLPGMPLPLHIFEERYKRMISECLAEDRPFGIVWFDGQSIRSAGCTARIVKVLQRHADGRMDILVRGERRFFAEAMLEEKPYMEADVFFIEDVEELPDPADVEKARALLRELYAKGYLTAEPEGFAFSDPRSLSFAIPAGEGFTHGERQRFLEMTSSAERLRKAVETLARIGDRVALNHQIQAIIGGNGHPPRDALRKLVSGTGEEAD